MLKEKITLNGKTYIEFNENQEINTNYVIIRGDRSGVFAGNLEKEEGREVTLKNCRRIWYWSGASSISELAVNGVKNPNSCKFPCEIAEVRIKDVIEVIPCTEKAKQSIENVPIWKA